jgi:micrococcal nuclease
VTNQARYKRWINEELVGEGFAWHFKRYSNDKTLAEAEIEARNAKRGLWQDAHPTPPWEYRRTEAEQRKARKLDQVGSHSEKP